MVSVLVCALFFAQSPVSLGEARKEAATSYLAGDFEKASKALSPFLKQESFLIGDKVLLAHALRAQGDQRAQTLYDEVLRIDDTNQDAHLGYFFMALDEGDNTQALKHLSHLKGDLQLMGQNMVDGANQTRAAISVGAALTRDGRFAQDIEANLSVATLSRTRLEFSGLWNPTGAIMTIGSQTRLSKRWSLRAGVGASYFGGAFMARAQVGASFRAFKNTTFSLSEALDLSLSPDLDFQNLEQNGAMRTLSTFVVEQNIHPALSLSMVTMLATFFTSAQETSLTFGAHFALPFACRSTLLLGTSYVNAFALNARVSVDVPLFKLLKGSFYAGTNSYFTSAGVALKYGY